MERRQMTRHLMAVLLFVSLATVLSPGAVAAGVPTTLTYQGTLTDGSGQPVTGDKTVTFALYKVPTGGTAFWTETQSLTLVDGRLSVALGASKGNPLDPGDFTGETYIGIRVAPDTEMPRQKFSSVAYAFQAADALPSGVIVMWHGSIDSVPNGWVLCDGSNGTPDLRDRFVIGAGNLYAQGSKGGSSTINLAHSHTVDSHNHSYSGSTSNAKGTKEDKAGGGGDSFDDHTHDFSGSTSSASGVGTDSRLSSTQSILPPYYSLAYIMKL